MKQPEFAESQFQAAIYAELQPHAPFISSQRIERWLAIDAALHPNQFHSVWNILNINIPPTGVAIGPSLWPLLAERWHSHLPTGLLCSLFLQAKVAKYQDGARCKHRLHFSGDYFEAKITSHQQKALVCLEDRLKAGAAVVRYVSPAFWSRTQFDDHNSNRRVLERSSFISPKPVGTHRKWMYSQNQALHLCNPDPEEVRAEAWESVVGSLREQARYGSLLKHVREIAQAIRGDNVNNEIEQAGWIRRLKQYQFAIDSETEQVLFYSSVIATFAAMVGVWWLIMLFPDGRDREPLVLHA